MYISHTSITVILPVGKYEKACVFQGTRPLEVTFIGAPPLEFTKVLRYP